MSASRGGGSGRARGANQRGGYAKRTGGGAPGAPPLAAQMRQLDRLQEPDEMALFRRYKDLEIIQVRSVYGRSGLLGREVQIPQHVLARVGVEANGPQVMSVLDADNLLQKLKEREERTRALARREARLPEGRRQASWSQLTADERRLLSLSQKEYNSFRAPQRGTPPAAGGKEKAPSSPAGDEASSSRST